jgi:Spy/CpxP family protein refolding chaperone
MNRSVERIAIKVSFVLLCVSPGMAGVQSSPPRTQRPPIVSRAPGAKRGTTTATDDFAGLKFTDEQQAKIDKIQKDIKLHMDAVVKDQKLKPEQKGAMLDGLARMQRTQIYGVLTPEQQSEVRKRVRARRAAEVEEQKKQSQQK